MLFMASTVIFFIIYYQKRMLQNKMQQQALESEYQKKLLETTIESQEAERKRIASELHDGVGAMLSAAKLNLNFLKTFTENKEDEEAITETKEIIDETIDTVRRISKDLLPSSLEKFGLIAAIKEFSEKVNVGITKVHFNHEEGDVSLPKDHELPVYRLVQEVVNNALKYAEAENIDIFLNNKEHFKLTIQDTGNGFDINAVRDDVTKGVGLYNIENRVNMLGGTMKLESEPGKGTRYTIELN